MYPRTLLLSLFFTILATALADDLLDENNLFFDFPSRTAKNWTGLDGWKFVPNNRTGMLLYGAPDTGENHQILILANEKSTTANLTSPLLAVQDGPSCLHFKFHIRVQNHVNYGLIVNSVTENGDRRRLWAMAREDFDIWERAEIQIERSQPLKIEFIGVQNPDGVIAFNSFHLRDGECDSIENIDCDFESDCYKKWHSNPLDGAIYQKSGEQEHFDIKREDHTTDSLFGHALIISRKERPFYISPPVSSSYHRCLTFAVMRNSPKLTFKVFRYNGIQQFDLYTPVLSDQSYLYEQYPVNEWHLVQIPDNFRNTTQYSISTYGSTVTNDIQIDDIKLRPNCIPEFNADFRHNFGEWRSPKSSQHRWRIGNGRVTNEKVVKSIRSHPLAAYTDFTSTSGGSSMKLLSGWASHPRETKCAQFDFVVRNFTTASKFSLEMITANNEPKTLWSYSSAEYMENVIYKHEKVVIPSSSAYYRLQFLAETDNQLMSAAIMKIEVDDASSDNCLVRKHK